MDKKWLCFNLIIAIIEEGKLAILIKVLLGSFDDDAWEKTLSVTVAAVTTFLHQEAPDSMIMQSTSSISYIVLRNIILINIPTINIVPENIANVNIPFINIVIGKSGFCNIIIS